ncbi:MAG: PAS domain-containing sensor histidine kinase, partial [Salinivenus sp.]
MVALVVYAFGPTGPVWSGTLAFSPAMASHLAFVVGSAVLVTATSAALYQRHLSFGQAQAQLQKHRDLLRRVQSVAQVGGWEYDPAQDVVTGTEKLTELLSISEEGTLGLDDGLTAYAPEARETVATAIDQCLTEGESFDLEVPLETEDASVRWARLRGQLRDYTGEGTRLTGTFQDITERKQREWALERERDRLQTLFENLPTPVVHCGIADGDGTIKGVNRAFETVFGVNASEVSEADLCAFFDPTDVGEMDSLIDHALDPPVQQVELTCDTVRGPREFALHFAARQQADGKVEGYAMFVDITEQKRRQEELERAKEEAEKMNRLKSTFLANMSHEIRTPLTSILGFSEAIEEAVTSPEETDVPIEEFSRRISKGGERLLETLDSVLNLSELEAGAMDLRLQPVNLPQEAADTVDLFQQKAEAADISLHTDLPDAPVYVRANPGALHRIERNLLSNALKYTEEGGSVVVRVRETDDAGVLEVEDTGIGMNPDEVDDLFTAFEQASTGPGRTYEGSGLGLAVVDRLVEQIDATIDVETAPGEGTCFRVEFPRTTPSINGNGADH